MNKNKVLQNISLISVLSIGVLATLLVVPVTDSFMEHSKFYSLVFGAIVVLLLFLVKTIKEKAFRVSLSPVSGPIFLFILATLASTFFTADYPVEGLLGLGGILLATSTIALLGGNLLPKDTTSKFLYMLTGSAVGLTVITIMQMVGFGPAQLINKTMGLSLPTSLSFNLAGSPFIALQIVALTLVTVVFYSIKTKKLNKFFAATLPILVIGTGLFIWSLLPGKETALRMPSLNASWSIMLDSIRAPKSALIGLGVNAYSNAYQTFKPVWLNGTQDWATTFSQATNMPLTVVTTMGILGLLTWGLVVVKSFKLYKETSTENKALALFIVLSFLLNIFLPFNTIMLTLQALAIACLVASEKHRLPLLQLQALKLKLLNKPEKIDRKQKELNLPFYLVTATLLLAVLGVGYLTIRSLQANIVMAQASKAIAKEDIVKAYELQQKAVAINPYYDVFRRRYSATSALIAVALSNKADITDSEKQQVSALLQQSVTEARAATTLDRADSQNWINLAQVTSNLIGVSKDAVNWTIQAYVSAIETNPTNPLLRLDLAEVFIGQKEYQQALNIYDQAINLKADLPILHYKRGVLLKQLDNPDALREARLSFQRALVLLPADSSDYITVNEELSKLEDYMKEKNISLEPEKKDTAKEQTQNQETSKLSAPSITEQNLNNTNAVQADQEPVSVDQTAVPQTPSEPAN